MRLRGGNAKPRRRSLKSNVYLSANESPFSLYNRITICIPLNVAIRPIETRLFYWPINRISFAWPFIDIDNRVAKFRIESRIRPRIDP